MRAYLRLESERLRRRNVRLQVIGRRDRIPKLLLQEIERAEFVTAEGECLHLRIAVDYSSREAITRTISIASERFSQEAQPTADSLQNILSSALSANSEDVDLLIRTGGEKRLSDFLLWESAYAELFFTDRMWPEFDTADLDAAVADFKHRERRFGSVPTGAAHSIAPCAGPIHPVNVKSQERS
jgi:undecaprenyl diphosphate synthase